MYAQLCEKIRDWLILGTGICIMAVLLFISAASTQNPAPPSPRRTDRSQAAESRAAPPSATVAISLPPQPALSGKPPATPQSSVAIVSESPRAPTVSGPLPASTVSDAQRASPQSSAGITAGARPDSSAPVQAPATDKDAMQAARSTAHDHHTHRQRHGRAHSRRVQGPLAGYRLRVVAHNRGRYPYRRPLMMVARQR